MIIDAHLDLAMNALFLGRDVTQSVLDTRKTDGPNKWGGYSTVGLKDLIRGEIAICFATVSVLAARAWMPLSHRNFTSLDEAHQQGLDQLNFYKGLEERGIVRMIYNRQQLQSHLDEWNQQPDQRRVGIVVLMEGAYPVRSPGEVHDWHAWGVRIIGLTWAGSAYAGGTYGPGRLSQAGKQLLNEMHNAGVILDISHLNDASFYDVLNHFPGPVLGTHVNCRAFVPGERQLTDAMIKALIQRDAVLGTACDTWMVVPGWKKKISSPATCPMDRLVDHIDHVCQLAGNSKHAAIGSDLDGGFGTEQSPGDLETIADLAKLAGLLSARGYQTADIENITHGNWLRKLRTAWEYYEN